MSSLTTSDPAFRHPLPSKAERGKTPAPLLQPIEFARLDAITQGLWGLLVFSLPFTDIEFPEAAHGFGQPSTYLAVVLWAVVLLRILRGKESLRFLKSKAFLFMFLFWAVAALSITQSSKAPPSPWFYAVPRHTSLEQFLQLSVGLSIAFFTAYFVRSWRDFRFAMTMYFAGWVGSVLAQVLDFAAYFDAGSTLLQGVNNFVHHTPWWQFIGPFPRLRLSTAEASWASDYLICLIPFFVMSAYYWKSRAWNLVNAFASTLVLFATMSFGGLAVFLGEAALMAMFMGKRAIGYVVLAGAAPLVLALVISPIYVSWVWNRAVGTADYGTESSDGSVRARTALAESAWDAFKEHPMLGVGIGDSPYYVPSNLPTWAANDPYVKTFVNSLASGNVCSLDLQILAETGLLGAGFLVILLATMALGLFKAYRRVPEWWKKCVYAAIFVALAGQVAHYTSMNRFHWHYWYFIWGLAICTVRFSGQPDHDLSGSRPASSREPKRTPAIAGITAGPMPAQSRNAPGPARIPHRQRAE